MRVPVGSRADFFSLPVALRNPPKGDAAKTVGTVWAVGLLGFLLERALALGVLVSPFELRALPVSQGMLAGYALLPMVSLLILGRDPIKYFDVGDWRSVAPLLGRFAAGIVAFSVYAALEPAFQAYYGRASLTLTFVASTLTALACAEFFFRGFLVLTLFPYIGWVAVVVALIPYTILHSGKPVIELLGSIPFGIALSYLAIRSGTVLYGFVLHALLALLAPALICVLAGTN